MKIAAAISSVLFVVYSGAFAAEDCDCTIFPFKPNPPCFDVCTAHALSKLRESNIDSVVNLLGLDTVEAAKIMEMNTQAYVPQTLDDYKAVLSPEQFVNVKSAFQDLNQRDFEELKRALTK